MPPVSFIKKKVGINILQLLSAKACKEIGDAHRVANFNKHQA